MRRCVEGGARQLQRLFRQGESWQAGRLGTEFARDTVWSSYSQAGPSIHFIRVGTLDDLSRVRPDIHIYTFTKQPWVILLNDVPAVVEFCKAADYWPAESVARFKAARTAAG
jgi:hypothetical protein